MDHDSDKPIPFAGWRCRECNYDLTGVGEERCPECGTAFDVEYTQRIADGRPALSTPWDMGWQFTPTLWQVHTRPTFFARRLATNPLVGRSALFAALVYVIAALAVYLGMIFRGGYWFLADPLQYSLNAVAPVQYSIGLGISIIVVHELFAIFLIVILRFRKPRNAWRTWRAIFHYHAGYAAFWLASVPLGFALHYLTGLVLTVLWIVSITRMARVLDKSAGSRRWIRVPIALTIMSALTIGSVIYWFVRSITSPGGV